MIKLTMLHYHNEGKWDTEFARKGSRGHPGNSWGREGEYNKDIYEIIEEQIKCCGFFFLKISWYLRKLALILPNGLRILFPRINLHGRWKVRFPKHAFFLSVLTENDSMLRYKCFPIQRFPANIFIKFQHNKFIELKISIQIFHSSLSLLRVTVG